MMQMNFCVPFIAALIPVLVGMIWYNPSFFGNVWMKEAGITPGEVSVSKMIKIISFTYLLSLLVAFALISIVIHQTHLFSLNAEAPNVNDPNSEAGKYLASLFNKMGNDFRTFKHGVFHGTMAGIMLAIPMIGMGAMYERRSFKYVMISSGFWIVSMALMGGVLCRFM